MLPGARLKMRQRQSASLVAALERTHLSKHAKVTKAIDYLLI